MTKRSSTQLAASGLVLLAATLWWKKTPDYRERVATFTTAARHSVTTPPVRQPVRENAEVIGIADIIGMKPYDWTERFDSDLGSVAQENRTDILEISAEIDQGIATGGDPRGPEAEFLAEAIIALLADPANRIDPPP